MTAANQGREIARRWAVLEPIAATEPHTAERALAIEAAERRTGVPRRTIQRWAATCDRHGWDMNALGRKRPADAGERRVFVSRPFDAAFRTSGNDVAQLAALGARTDELLDMWWASPAQRAGWWRVGLEVTTALESECREHGLGLPASAFWKRRNVYHLSKRRIQGRQATRVLDIYENDRKRFDDAKPRIRLDHSVHAPMERIVMDVKTLDNLVYRPNGTITQPRLIGFMDNGTRRLFAHIVLLNEGEGIRQEHVRDGFVAMVADPNWGFPEQLLRDNGSEFFLFDKIRTALEMLKSSGGDPRTIINAKPYSGASEPIESMFSMLDRQVFSQMEGYVGGDRMKRRTQSVGKTMTPYSGSFEQFVAEGLDRIADFEGMELRSGPFKGRSPVTIYQDHLDGGWRPIAVDPVALDAAFAETIERRVQRGVIIIKNRRYWHPELPNGQHVTIAIPCRRDAEPIVNLGRLGWARLEPETRFLPGQAEGAIATGRAQARNERVTRQARRALPRVADEGNRRDRVTALPTRAAPAPLMDVMLATEAETMGSAFTEAAARRAAEPSEAEKKRLRLMRETKELERHYGRG